MIVISEKAARRLVSPADAIQAVECAFKEAAHQRVLNFPVVRERLAPGADVYGIKSAAAMDAGVLGLKIGGYWAGNAARNVTNHQSTTVLSDPATGQPIALVGSNYLTGLRTAAACALAIKKLARRDAVTLGLIGAGAQALFHLELALLVWPFKRLLVNSLHPESAGKLLAWAAGLNIDAQFQNAETVVRNADVLVTLTPSKVPVVDAAWVKPGTHISAMGADTMGKQELAIEIMAGARVYVDDWIQAASIGESQSAVRAGLLDEHRIAGSLGSVLVGATSGRQTDQEITVFDSTGVAVQDLAVAHRAYQAAKCERGEGIHHIDLLE